MALFLAIVVYAYLELAHDSILIQPFSVPKQYSDAGLTPEVMASRIKDSLNEIETQTETMMKKDHLSTESDQVPVDIKVPSTEVGLKTAIEIARTFIPFLPQTRSVDGEITMPAAPPDSSSGSNTHPELQITIRIKQGSGTATPITIPSSASDASAVARSAARIGATRPPLTTSGASC